MAGKVILVSRNILQYGCSVHMHRTFLKRAATVGSIVIFWWDIVVQSIAKALLEGGVLSWLVGIISRRGGSYKEFLVKVCWWVVFQ